MDFNKPLLFSIFGITNVGKSTLIDRCRDIPDLGVIEVGKEMRRRHPPEYFKGLAALPETETEVWQICEEQYAAAANAGKRAILVDGQPRMPSQVVEMYRRFGPYRVIHLYASHPTLAARAAARDTDPGKVELNRKRLVNDYNQLYHSLMAYEGVPENHVDVVVTEIGGWQESALEVIRSYINLQDQYREVFA